MQKKNLGGIIMLQISVKNMEKSFAANTIFKNISFDINEGEKVSLVGVNGSGKSTLFKIITGELPYDNGSINVPKNTTIGYLEQQPSYPENFTVNDVIDMSFSDIHEIAKKLSELEKDLSSEKNLKKYGNLQEKFEKLGGYTFEYEKKRICTNLKLTFLNKKFSTLSGGEKTIALLAKVLLEKPSFLMLDEPTNHLDIFAIEWLEDYLKNYDGTVLLISHDKYFLDAITNKTIELRFEKAVMYHGNYSFYLKERQIRYDIEEKEFKNQQKEIKRIKDQITQYIIWSNGGQNEKFAKKAKELKKRLEKMDKIEKPTLDETKMNLNFKELNKSSRDVIVIENLNKSFDDKVIFDNLNFLVKSNEKICIIGENGSGKSTLIKMILNELEKDSGAIKIGPNVHFSYLSQHIKFERDVPLLDYIRYELELSEEKGRSLLASFNFYKDDLFKKTSTLSGGEKVRLRLCEILQKDINFLILDEPTNHLDLHSKKILEDKISKFNGTILFISHDRHFIDKISTKIAAISNKKIKVYDGNYSYYKAKTADEAISLDPVKKSSKQTVKNKKEKESTKKKNPSKMKMLEKRMKDIEFEISRIDMDILNSLSNYSKLGELNEQKSSFEKEYESLLEEYYD